MLATQASAGRRARRRGHWLGFAADGTALVRDAAERWIDDACYRLGASLAYYALFSLFPLLLLSVTAVGYVLGDDDKVRRRLLSASAKAISPEARALLDQTLASMQQHHTARGVGALVGGLTLLLGASGVFSELQSSLDFIWRVKPAPRSGIWSSLLSMMKARLFSFAVVAAAASFVLASLAVSAVLGAASRAVTGTAAGRAVWVLVDAAASLGLLTLILAAIYRVVPQTPVAWRDVFGAAFVTALLFTLLKSLLAWYLAHIGSYAAYGAVGAVLGLLTWIYVACLLLLFGAELGHLRAERFGSLAPAKAAAPLPPNAASPR